MKSACMPTHRSGLSLYSYGDASLAFRRQVSGSPGDDPNDQ
jgi:hypothetical protein